MSESEEEETHAPTYVEPGYVKGTSLLEMTYDKCHRAYLMTERVRKINPTIHVVLLKFDEHVIIELVCVQTLVPLRLRHHGHFQEMMPYDDRYTVHIQALELLAFIHMVNHGTPHMNPDAITALVDRWRPETHSFYLHTGEMTVTIQDMSMILALPI